MCPVRKVCDLHALASTVGSQTILIKALLFCLHTPEKHLEFVRMVLFEVEKEIIRFWLEETKVVIRELACFVSVVLISCNHCASLKDLVTSHPVTRSIVQDSYIVMLYFAVEL